MVKRYCSQFHRWKRVETPNQLIEATAPIAERASKREPGYFGFPRRHYQIRIRTTISITHQFFSWRLPIVHYRHALAGNISGYLMVELLRLILFGTTRSTSNTTRIYSINTETKQKSQYWTRFNHWNYFKSNRSETIYNKIRRVRANRKEKTVEKCENNIYFIYWN